MLTIVGAGPGPAANLTRAAAEALDRADIIYIEPQARTALGAEEAWLSKVVEEFPPDGSAPCDAFADREAAWVVPDTPALYPPVHAWIATLDRQDWEHIRVISGVPVMTAALDREGMFLPSCQVQIHLSKTHILHWNGEGWHGRIAKVDWASCRPLNRRRIVFLRGGSGIARAARWLENWGASVELYPLSRLADPDSYEGVDHAIHRLDRYDWMIFTSGEAVSRWHDRMRLLSVDIRRMRAKIAAVGPETAARIRDRGLVPDLIPAAEYSQEGLVRSFQDVPVRGTRMLFPAGQLNRNILSDDLRGRGALVDVVIIYQNQSTLLPEPLQEAIRGEVLDAMVFTASSQAEYLVEQLSPDDRRHLANIPIFSIGPLTTRSLHQYGVLPVREAPAPSVRLLAEAVRDYYVSQSDRS